MSRTRDELSLSRREVLRTGALGAGALLVAGPSASAFAPPKVKVKSAGRHPPGTTATYDFSRNWLFGGVYVSGAEQPGYGEAGFTPVTIPHTVVALSWGDWDHTQWEKVFVYRRHLRGEALPAGRVFLDFDAVMTTAIVCVNGVQVAQHQGGYLPWSVELTGLLQGGDNVLAVLVDSRWLDVPPEGNPQGASSVDYFQPGGIVRDVRLRVVPQLYLSDVFAAPVDVLSGSPGLKLQATIDAAVVPAGPVQLTTQLLDGRRLVGSASSTVTVGQTGTSVAGLTISGLEGIGLWSPDSPKLYTVNTTLTGPNLSSHTFIVRTGFREAVFATDGFYLNGERLEIFGLNRHGLFPYLGMAAPARLQRRDAQLLREELNCNMVRCSHYPQSSHFLDACDELGLMVWEEPPGWQYVGDDAFQQLVLQNVHDMVVRDRSRPSVVIWGTRLNETGNYPTLYAQARELAMSLDGSRQTSGAMDVQSTVDWAEDVFAYDDYHTSTGSRILAPSDGTAILEPPVAGVPYLVTEAVGALSGPPLYRWIDSAQTLALQAQLHAQVHNLAHANPAYAGLLGWAGIDYASIVGGNRVWHNLRWPGVLDTFRVPKPGASIYQSQVNPVARAVIVPAFFWDFGPQSPADGPGPGSLIATNCDRLELFVGGQHFATATPDTQDYGNLAYPPAFVDLTVGASGLPDLRIDGYVGARLVHSVSMSCDTARDTLSLILDDTSITADGSDATRATFRSVDAYGNQRPYVSGSVTLAVSGPATLVGQNPFDFATFGGVGGVFLRSQAGRTGTATIAASHPVLGGAEAKLTATSDSTAWI